MLIAVSWRNIWRSRTRSLVVIIAITLGIMAGVFSTAFMKGMMVQRLETAIRTEISNIQIHDSLFRKTSETKYFIPQALLLTRQTDTLTHVTGVTPRIVVQSMISSAETGTGVTIMGVIPDREKKVTDISEKLIEGKYFEGVRRKPIVISRKLADKLNIHLRSRVVITLQDLDRNLVTDAFRVAGIYKTTNTSYDETHVFVRYEDLRSMTALPPGAAHEIAVRTDNDRNTPAVQEEIREMAPQLEVLNWQELSPELTYITAAMDQYMYLFIAIILMALLFGIINTMLMVILERQKEIGMLLAIGMSRARIFFMIIIETVLLSLTGGLTGILLGTLVSKYFEVHYIDLSMFGKGLEQWGYNTMVHTLVDSGMVVTVTFMVIVTGILAAVYPAWKAIRYDPAEALRME
jgi:ABC-type lipoprotein release transport system permease subunit